MRFKHFIITRFNVNIHPTEYPFRLSETWLMERLEYFKQFCFPSVSEQRNQNFTWLVLFDEKTPERFKRFIRIFGQYPNFTAMFCGEFSTIMPQVRRYLAQACQKNEYCLTTRLDNDDAISRDFVGVVHEAANTFLDSRPAEPFEVFFNFPNGLQYSSGTVYDFRDMTNAFISFMENSQEPNTVFCVDHPSIYERADVVQVETEPIFLQHVHERNVYNYIRGSVSQSKSALDDFVLNL